MFAELITPVKFNIDSNVQLNQSRFSLLDQFDSYWDVKNGLGSNLVQLHHNNRHFKITSSETIPSLLPGAVKNIIKSVDSSVDSAVML